MSTKTTTITDNGSLVVFKDYEKHKESIDGLIEVGGDFSGGTLELFISLTGGTTKNSWNDLNRNPFSITTAETRKFAIPTQNKSSGSVILYYTLSGASTPNITLTIGDNT